jgi:hypothetical protein
MSATTRAANDLLSQKFNTSYVDENTTDIELLVAAFIELREEVATLRRQRDGAPPARVSDDDGYVSLLVAARQIGRSNEYLRQQVVKGKIAGVFEDGKWLVRLDEVEALRRR